MFCRRTDVLQNGTLHILTRQHALIFPPA